MSIYVRDEHGVLQALKIPAYKGEKGEAGVTPNLQVGDVVTLEAGQQATIVRRGDDENPIFDFSIPKGDDGKDGIYVGKVVDAPSHAQVVVNDDPTPYDLFFENANVDYMGNTYTSLKEKADADIEYLLRKFGTQHYEGTNITATDTYQKQVKSAMFKGQTLVNLFDASSDNETWSCTISSDGSKVVIEGTWFASVKVPLKNSTTYTLFAKSKTGGKISVLKDYKIQDSSEPSHRYQLTAEADETHVFTTSSDGTNYGVLLYASPTGNTYEEIRIFEGDYTKQDIPYFEGMKSVKSPVLTTINYHNKGLYKINLTSHVEKISKIRYKITHPGTNGYYCAKLAASENFSKAKTYTLNFRVIGKSKDVKVDVIKPWNSGVYNFNPDLNSYDLQTFAFSPLVDSYRGDIFGIQLSGTQTKGLSIEFEFWITEGLEIKSSTITTPSDLILRGIDNVHDTVDLNTGEYIQRIETRLYQQGDESNAEVLTDKVNTVYKLAQPITTKIDLKGQKIYSYDGTTHYTTKSLDGHPAPILSIDVPTNTPKMIARQREEIQTLSVENEALKEEVVVANQQRKDGDVELLGYNFDLDFRLMEIECSLDLPISLRTKGVKDVNTYKTAKTLILAGNYERADMEHKLAVYLKRGRLTQEEYDELIALMDAREMVE